MKLNAISTVLENFKNSFPNFCLETLMRIESLLKESQKMNETDHPKRKWQSRNFDMQQKNLRFLKNFISNTGHKTSGPGNRRPPSMAFYFQMTNRVQNI